MEDYVEEYVLDYPEDKNVHIKVTKAIANYIKSIGIVGYSFTMPDITIYKGVNGSYYCDFLVHIKVKEYKGND